MEKTPMTTPDIAGLCKRLRGWPSPKTGADYSVVSIKAQMVEAADTLERQAAERDALRLAILGGEDVPGVAATVSIDQCIRFLTEERQRNEWSAEQQAKLERQAAGIERLRTGLENVAAYYGPDHRVTEIARAALTGEDA
jgi:hypothetical protein